jgi:hypothetical protein
MSNVLTYTPTQHDFFEELTTLFINLASFSVALESFANAGSSAVPNDPKYTITLNGRIVDVSFPTHALLHGIVKNQWPAAIQLSICPATQALVASPNPIKLQCNNVSRMITRLVGAMFLQYYERNAHRPKAKYSGNQKKWPDVWRFAWLLRNAIAHGDTWNLSDPSFPPTTWKSVTITNADSGEVWNNIARYIGGGDVVLLMEELATAP